MRVTCAILMVALAAGVDAQGPAQAPPRDAPKPKAATAAVTGRVTDRETGAPVRRAAISLFSPDGQNRFETSADADGRYEFPAVPAGDYYATASSGEHSSRYLAKSFALDQSSGATFGQPPPLELKAGETRRAVDFALDRTFAIEGRVMNEYGEPLAHMIVGVQRVDRPGGSRTQSTDDRGSFRLYGLAPGEYRVCANAGNQPWDGLYRPTAGDVFQTGFTKTCYPAMTGSAASSAVPVKASDVVGIVIQMQRARAHTLSGRIVHESGAPVESASVTIARVEEDRQWSSSRPVEFNRGLFIARGLTPGDYVIRAASQDPADGPGSMTPREFAFAPITIDATDVTTVMTTTRGVDIAGRIVFEGDAKPPLRDVRLQVVAQRDNDAQFYMNLPTPMAPVQADLTFEVSRLYGPVILRLQGLPEGWIVRSVRYGQVDIVDATTEFAQGAESRNVEVIATNRTTQLTARPVEDNGQPATNAVVLLVPRDPARWKGGLFSAILRSRKDGTVLFPPRLPGEYFIMAVPAEDVARVSRSTDLLRSLTERAQRITLRENEHPAIDVRVLRLSGSR